jgi:hypothetical protein
MLVEITVNVPSTEKLHVSGDALIEGSIECGSINCVVITSPDEFSFGSSRGLLKHGLVHARDLTRR